MVSYQHHSFISGNLNTPHKVSIDSTFSEMTVQQEIPLKKQWDNCNFFFLKK
jgi:hypothetical protein